MINAPPPADDHEGTILIVDDAPDNLRFLSSLLTEAGYSVRRVISGTLAIEAAQLDPPDLILLDLRMPGMHGYEVCQHLKRQAKTRQIPVIFLSALDEELDKVQAFQIGGVDYITKPFQVVEVLARVEMHLKLSRHARYLNEICQECRRSLVAITEELKQVQEMPGRWAPEDQQHLQDIERNVERLGSLMHEARSLMGIESSSLPGKGR